MHSIKKIKIAFPAKFNREKLFKNPANKYNKLKIKIFWLHHKKAKNSPKTKGYILEFIPALFAIKNIKKINKYLKKIYNLLL